MNHSTIQGIDDNYAPQFHHLLSSHWRHVLASHSPQQDQIGRALDEYGLGSHDYVLKPVLIVLAYCIAHVLRKVARLQVRWATKFIRKAMEYKESASKMLYKEPL